MLKYRLISAFVLIPVVIAALFLLPPVGFAIVTLAVCMLAAWEWGQLSGFTTHHAILLEPQRIIPPLVASIVDGHQVGVIVPVEEIMPMQRQKWLSLEKSPYYALANPFTGSDSELLSAGKTLLEQGADVLVLDCLGYYQHHRDVLQKALDVPVLLSNVLVSRLAAELLV